MKMMKKFFKIMIVSLTFLFVTFTGIGIHAASLAFKDNKGSIVSQGQDYIVRMVDTPGSSIKTAEALFIIKGAPGAVYKIITDYEHYPEFMPNITKTKVLEKSALNTKCKFNLKVALINIEYSLTLKSSDNKLPYSVSWNFIEGDIKNTTGSWAIYKEGPDTLVLYSVHTEPGRLVPDWIANKLGTESIPDMITAIRKRVEKN
jgi:coenzyme Q-binding protein COQ10